MSTQSNRSFSSLLQEYYGEAIRQMAETPNYFIRRVSADETGWNQTVPVYIGFEEENPPWTLSPEAQVFEGCIDSCLKKAFCE